MAAHSVVASYILSVFFVSPVQANTELCGTHATDTCPIADDTVALQFPAADARGRPATKSSSTTVEPRAVGIVEPGIPAVAAVVAPQGIIEAPSAYHGVIDNPPPLYRITADTLYDAGLQHGSMANWRIRAWFSTSGMTALSNGSASQGLAKAPQMAAEFSPN